MTRPLPTLRPVVVAVVGVLAVAIGLAPTPARAEPSPESRRVPRPAPETLQVAGAGKVTLYTPTGAPRAVVLFLSGDGGWNLGVVSMAERLRDEGALVAGIDIRAFMKGLAAGPSCAYPGGVLEEVSRAVQLHAHVPAYRAPILVGYSSGATMAYAALAAAPAETFAGAISLGFCADLEIGVPMCQMRGLHATKRKKGIGYDLAPFAANTVPWMVLHGDQDQVCNLDAADAFVKATGAATLFRLPKVGHGFGVPARWEPAYLQAYHAVTAAATRSAPAVAQAPAVADLSLVEVPATSTAGAGDTLAVLLTGDGGWAEIDKALAAELAGRGIPVVGWSSLSYYWTPRTPDGAAADLARIVSHYTTAWHRPRVVVVGYSFGADVAPFLVNRLPAADRAQVSSLVLLAPSDTAAFAFHVAEWLGHTGDDVLATRPELSRLAVPTTCVAPADDRDSPCANVNPRVQVVAALSGHHFGSDYARLAGLVEQAIMRAAPMPRADGGARPIRTAAPTPASPAARAPLRAARRSSSAAP